MKNRFLVLLAIATLAFTACNGSEGKVAESISVAPESLNAPAKLNSQIIELTANCDWTVKAIDAESKEVRWLEPTKKSGSGDARVVIKLLQNQFKDERSATLVFTTKNGKTAQVAVTQEGDPNSDVEAHSVKLRIGTFNLRQSTIAADQGSPERDWKVRKTRVMQAIKDCNFDVFGINEADTQIQNDLIAGVGDSYAMQIFSPYSQDGKGSRAQGLMYKKAKFDLEDWHFFWPSDNVDLMSRNDFDPNDASKSTYCRGGCCGILRHKASGVRIFVMVSHGFLNAAPRAQWAHIYSQQAERYNPDKLPCFFIGDMNSRPDESATQEYLKYWKDTFLELPVQKRMGPDGTFSAWGSIDRRIDYLYYRGNIEPIEYTCANKKYDGFAPSDHCPIYADFNITSTQ